MLFVIRDESALPRQQWYTPCSLCLIPYIFETLFKLFYLVDFIAIPSRNPKSANVYSFFFPSGLHTQKRVKTQETKAACNSFFFLSYPLVKRRKE